MVKLSKRKIEMFKRIFLLSKEYHFDDRKKHTIMFKWDIEKWNQLEKEYPELGRIFDVPAKCFEPKDNKLYEAKEE